MGGCATSTIKRAVLQFVKFLCSRAKKHMHFPNRCFGNLSTSILVIVVMDSHYTKLKNIGINRKFQHS